MDSNTLLYLIIGVFVILAGWIIRLEMRIHKLCAGANGKSLEDAITGLKHDVGELFDASKTAHGNIANLRARYHKSIQRVETLRFNPFRGTGEGGNQSFVTALADEDGNGVVLSGLYARGGLNIYAKPIKKFESEIAFSDEEKEVVEKIKIGS